MTIFLFIRHGENDFVGKRLAGHLPGVHLNEKGHHQAQLLAQSLAKAPIQAVYSSPLERAVESAQPLAECLGVNIQIVVGLAEINYGSWQGKTVKQMQRMKMWKIVQEHPSLALFPGGESFSAAQKRLIAAVEEINQQHEDNEWVACFSHCDAIRLLIAHYLNMPLDDFQRIGVDTASISVISLGKGVPRLGVINYRPEMIWEK